MSIKNDWSSFFCAITMWPITCTGFTMYFSAKNLVAAAVLVLCYMSCAWYFAIIGCLLVVSIINDVARMRKPRNFCC